MLYIGDIHPGYMTIWVDDQENLWGDYDKAKAFLEKVSLREFSTLLIKVEKLCQNTPSYLPIHTVNFSHHMSYYIVAGQ